MDRHYLEIRRIMEIHLKRQKQFISTIALLLLFITSQFAKAQISVFYYDDGNETYKNNQVIKLLEASNKDIYLLGKAADNKYQEITPLLIRVDKKANLLFQKIISSESLYDLKGMILLPNQNIKIFGTSKTNDKYYPYERTITPDGAIKTEESSFSVFSTWINDVKYLNDNRVLIVETKDGKAGKFNISIFKVNTQNNNQEWHRKISSEDNEEADQILVLKDKKIIILGKKYADDLLSYVPIIYKLSSEGKQIWKKGIDVPKNFYNQSISVDENGILYYICGYTKESTGLCETRLITLSSDNKEINHITFKEISANGILALKNGNFFIYGSNIFVKSAHVITKAKYIIFNKNFKTVSKKQLGNKDVPDSEFTKNKFNISPTNSDLLTAIQLSDGRIACAGKVFMPNMKNIKNSSRRNNALLLLIDKNW